MTKEIIKLIIELDKYKQMREEFRFGLAHINIGNYQNPFDDIKYTDLENVNKLFKSIEQ